MKLSADVAVIGGGIVGLACVLALREAGRSVLLVERNDIATGASYANAGAFAFSDVMPLASPGIMRRAPGWLLDPLGPLTVRPAYLPKIAPWLWRFARASTPAASRHSMRAQVDLMRLARTETLQLLRRTNLCSMLRSDGALELYESVAEREAALPNWDAREREGIEFEHVSRERIDALQPGLSPLFTHGTFVPGWKTISDPYAYARALFARGLDAGATVSWNSVVSLRPDGDTALLRLENGDELRAGHAVVAGGAWSKPLAASLGDVVPLETERGYNTTLAPDSFDLKRQITFGGHGFVVTPLSCGIRVGGAVELAGLDLPPNYRRAETMLRKAERFLPGLRTENGRQWMGFRPSMPDSLPVIGRANATPRVVYAFGHGHLGLTQSAATARLVADLVAGRPTPIDLSPFSPARFR